MKKIKDHIDDLFKRIPNSEQKELIKQEIAENLEEKVYDLMAQGKNEEDAINKAIVDFGDISDIEKELGVKLPAKKHLTKLDLGFSICGSVLIIALVIFINFYYTPGTIWFVYPTFGVLWWPLSMSYRWLRQK